MGINEMDIRTSDFYNNENVNFFDINHEFFIIDSEHLNDVQTRMYGFSVQDTGIYEEENMTAEAAERLDGTGVYVYVENLNNGTIRIRQDYNGSYGLYLFQSQDYFALSNSFFQLLDHIKFRYSLSINRDFANHIILDTLSSYAYSETAVNEIRVIPKDVIVLIDRKSEKLQMMLIDYNEDSLYPDSIEGITVLDHWFHKWITVFRNIKSKTDQMMVSLSGGIDSRITFLLALKSGINLSEIRVNSNTDNLHTHSEDYSIASEIADFYGFSLNNVSFSSEAVHYSLEDIINIAFYTKMTFHKEMYYKHNKYAHKRYVIPGDGGESIRSYWDMSAQDFIKEGEERASRYSGELSKEFSESVRRILQSAYDAIDRKYNIEDKNSSKYPMFLHRESRDRNHFGKSKVEEFFANTYSLTPLIDPDIRKIKLCTDNCNDNNLLITLIFVRYCPSLLKFKFQGDRHIDQETIRIAQQISNKFPVNDNIFSAELNENFVISTEDMNVLSIIEKSNNKTIPIDIPDKYLKSVFDSSYCHKLFTIYFDEEIYDYAKENARKAKFFPLRECYPVIGMMRVIDTLLTGEQIRKPSIINEMDRMISTGEDESEDSDKIIEQLKDFMTARIDILCKGELPDYEVLKISDKKAKIIQPEWFQKDGKGYVITSYNGNLDIILHIKTTGVLCLYLRGIDVKEDGGKRIPYWINYQKLQYNDLQIINQETPVWHDKPFKCEFNVNKDDIVTLHIEWGPYRKDEA